MTISYDRWAGLLDRMSIAEHRDAFDRLHEHYSQGHRKYHNEVHIADCLDQLDSCGANVECINEVELAIWFHDAIYDVHATDNELQSADWASRFLRTKNVNESIAGRVHASIMATRHNVIPMRPDEQLVVDIDLSILGRGTTEYDQFEVRIRQEYEWVPRDVFCQKRAEILQSFLDRIRIYSTDWFAQNFEQQARTKLRRAIKRLLEQWI